MTKVGFSTTQSWVSRVIRWATHATTSHAFLVVDWFGEPCVVQADWTGFSVKTFKRFQEEAIVVALVTPQTPIDAGLPAAFDWLGERYDYAGLFGMAVVEFGRLLRRHWRNPWQSPRALFCSESVVKVLQAAKYPGAEHLDAASTSPEDLLEFLR